MLAPPTLLRRLAPLLVLLPIASAAEPPDEITRWIPSIGIRSGVLGQHADADVSSGTVSYQRTNRVRLQNPRPSPPNPPFIERVTNQQIVGETIRPAADGEDLLITPFMAGTLELMTPGLQMLPGKPRLFVHGDAGYAFGTERHLARERAPTSLPPGNPIVGEPNFVEDAVEGIGSETTAEVQPLVISAGAGIAFSFDLFGRRVRIKPSAEYLREEIDFTGAVISAKQSDTGIQEFPQPPFPPITQKPSLFIPITIKSSESEVFQGVGAGLEIEVDTLWRAGPFGISLFMGAQGVKLLGDTEVEFSGSTTVTNSALRPTPTQTMTADFSFEKDPWSYSGGIGVRFRFLPEWD